MLDTRLWEELLQKRLTLDQTSTLLDFERDEVEQFYLPLALRILKLRRRQGRILAAVAGPPGCGKTAFATLLAAVINAESHDEAAVVIGQDGWHYPNSYLETHTIRYRGQEMTLRQLKGSPETYDTQAAYTFLRGVKAGEPGDYPVYSRVLHNPILNAGKVLSNHQFIVLEGNYWLLQEDPWRPFQALFDETIFLAAAPESLVEGLRQRHLRGGKTTAFTQNHLATVDLPNMERVLKNSAPAGVVVHKTDNRHISGVAYLTAG